MRKLSYLLAAWNAEQQAATAGPAQFPSVANVAAYVCSGSKAARGTDADRDADDARNSSPS